MSVSKTILIGTLGKAPAIGQTQDSKDYANFSLATSKRWKDAKGNKQEKTSWHNISCWGSLVKVCQYLDKGSKIYLEGELEYGTYKNKEGVEVPSVKIIASVIDIIKGKEKESEVSQHAIHKGNGYAPESNHVKEEDSDEIPF
jgi:single-strand DNA-binding protein